MSGLSGLNAADHVEQEVKPELVHATVRLTQEESARLIQEESARLIQEASARLIQEESARLIQEESARLIQEESKVDVLVQAMRHSHVRSLHAQVTTVILSLCIHKVHLYTILITLYSKCSPIQLNSCKKNVLFRSVGFLVCLVFLFC